MAFQSICFGQANWMVLKAKKWSKAFSPDVMEAGDVDKAIKPYHIQ